ncbi:hypothetical protein MMC13_007522 [Lambiella insularis]|nr:hypothetical protein [Lambiella insularis]
MSFARRPTSWAALVRHRTTSVRSSAFRQSRQQWHRRGYASEGNHASEKAKSDLPWLAGSIAVTVPSCWYLLREGPANPSHHGHHEPGNEDSHEAFEAARKGTDAGDEEEKDGAEAQKGDGEGDDGKEDTSGGDGQKSDDSPPSGSEGEAQKNVPSTNEGSDDSAHETEPGDDVEGIRGKGATKDGPPGDTRKHIPDAKGYNKKRIESDYAQRQGEKDSEEQEPDKGDKASTSKEAGSQLSQSGKQEGLTNTDTKHSTDLSEREDTPMKPEGPESAKAKGTVDPSRPQV